MKKLLIGLLVLSSMSAVADCNVKLINSSLSSLIVAEEMNEVKSILNKKGYLISHTDPDLELKLFSETLESYRQCLYCDSNQLIRGGTYSEVTLLKKKKVIYTSSAQSTKFLGLGKKITARKEYLTLVKSIPSCGEL